jgi:hypothetical protein
MKKIVVFVLLLISVSVKAQNPDGRNASLHITPSWLWGSANYIKNTPVFYPATMSYDAQIYSNPDNGLLTYPHMFGVNVMMKIPTASYLTLSVSYSYNQRYEEVKEYVHYWSLNGNTHTLSFTASIYNLFSVY